MRELARRADAQLQERAIETEAHAEQARFLGSPSVRVDDVDVEPGAQARTDFGLKCRLYRSADGQSGLPPPAWIEDALRGTGAR